MSLLRNFSPDGSEPDDDEQPPTAAPPDETARPDEAARADTTAPAGGGQAPGTARYAFAGPAAGTAAGTAPAPVTVVPSEVIDEPGDRAAETPPPAEAADPEKTPASGLKAYPATEMSSPFRETAPPETSAPEADAPETAAPETAAPETAPVPELPRRTTPATVPSPRATGEDEPGGQPGDLPGPDLTAPLLGDAAELRARWQRVQGDFVDDPQAAVSDADALVGQTAEALMAALRQRQRQLRTAWQRGAANGQAPEPGVMDTEHLRLMMQRYRALFNQLCRPS
jgi:hypothetical protein